LEKEIVKMELDETGSESCSVTGYTKGISLFKRKAEAVLVPN